METENTPDNNLKLKSAASELMIENVVLRQEQIAQKSEITLLRTENAELRRQNTELINQVSSLQIAIEYYEEQARLYRYQLFGQSSEKTEELCAQNEELKDNKAEDLAGSQPKIDPNDSDADYLEYEVKGHTRRKRKGKRKEDLSNLPVERVEYKLPEDQLGCPDCGGRMRDIGVEVRQELVFIPGKYIVREHVIHKYACDHNKDKTSHTLIIEADAPKPLIEHSLATPSAVSLICVQKYVYCVPLYRLEQGFKRDGFFLSRQTMANWVIKSVDLYLASIYFVMIKILLNESVLHSDATTLQVLHEVDREAKTKSYEWLYRTTGCASFQIVIYEYTQTKGRVNPALFLKAFHGFLHCDGDETYRKLDGIITVGCWTHARRRFHDVIKAQPIGAPIEGTYADRAVTCINYLFHLERMYENLIPAERYKRRLELSKPIADSFFDWAKAAKRAVSPEFPIGKAVNYALNQQEYLQNVFLDGRLELSNNRAERSIKPFVMGRKNWLFSNTPEGAYASSVMYSIIETARENGLDPYRYINYLLETLPNTTTNGIDALLPWSVSLPEECRSLANMRKTSQDNGDDEY